MLKIKLMADYGSYPLWWEEPDLVGNINPNTLAISQELVVQLEEWSDMYDKGIINEESFEQEGIRLWIMLNKELNPNYQVFYFSEKLRNIYGLPK